MVTEIGTPFTQNREICKSDYVLMKHAFDMTGGFKDGTYILPFEKESESSTALRRSITPTDKVFGNELRDQFTPLRSGENRIEESGDKDLDAFVKNVDSKGAGVIEFSVDNTMLAKLYGYMIYVIDKKDSIPYVYPVNPTEVVEYRTTDIGAVNYIKFAEDKTKIINSMTSTIDYQVWYRVFKADGDGYTTYRTQTGETSGDTVSDEVFDLIDLDFWPIFVQEMNVRSEEDRLPLSEYYDLMRKTIAMYNLKSLFFSDTYKTCFPFLHLQDAGQGNITVGADRVIRCGGDVKYVTPPNVTFDVIKAEYESLATSIRQSMNSTIEIASTASGDARRAAEKRRVDCLKANAIAVSKLVDWILNVAYRGMLQRDKSYTIGYTINTNFSENAFEDSVGILSDLSSLGVLNQNTIKALALSFIEKIHNQDKKLIDDIKKIEENSNVLDIEDGQQSGDDQETGSV